LARRLFAQKINPFEATHKDLLAYFYKQRRIKFDRPFQEYPIDIKRLEEIKYLKPIQIYISIDEFIAYCRDEYHKCSVSGFVSWISSLDNHVRTETYCEAKVLFEMAKPGFKNELNDIIKKIEKYEAAWFPTFEVVKIENLRERLQEIKEITFGV